MPDPELRARLDAGAAQLGVALPEEAQEKLIAYLHLLQRWNRVYNLTAVRDPEQMVGRHLLDSLAAAPLLQGSRFIDVGSGAGLPGIPLALARPESSWVLLDSSAKRCRFLIQAVAELGLTGVEVVHGRVERYRPATPFDCVVTRAFAALGETVGRIRHLLAEQGCLVALKGRGVERELESLPPGFALRELRRLEVPATKGARYAAVLAPCPDQARRS